MRRSSIAADIPRFTKLGVIASMQPNHLLTDMNWAEDRLGPKRAAYSYAWKAFLDAGVPLAFGTDYPVEPITPFRGLYAAVTRMNEAGTKTYFPENKLTRGQALYAYTQGSAYAEFAEKHKGKLRSGLRCGLHPRRSRPRQGRSAGDSGHKGPCKPTLQASSLTTDQRVHISRAMSATQVNPRTWSLSMKLRAYLLMLFVVAVWGSTFVVIKGALADATPAAFNLVRMTLAFALLAAAYHRLWRGIRRSDLASGALVGLCLAAGYQFQTIGLVSHHAEQIGLHHRPRRCTSAALLDHPGSSTAGCPLPTLECLHGSAHWLSSEFCC